MNKEFTPYQEALELKELGFNKPCFALFINEKFHFIFSEHQLDTIVLAPTYSQAFGWFREKYGLSGNIDCCDKLCEWNIKSSKLDKSIFSNKIQSYEEAELACLIKLIEIVKGGDK